MTDSFINNKKMVSFPKKDGWYWFWGYRFGKKTGNSENEKELILCRCRKISNGIMVIGDGQFMYEKELEEAKFIPATLPITGE